MNGVSESVLEALARALQCPTTPSAPTSSTSPAPHTGRQRRRARHVLGYRPRYSSLDALRESLRWLAANGHVNLGEQEF